MGGGFGDLGSLFEEMEKIFEELENDDANSSAEDYTEETTDGQGNRVTKHVQRGPGFSSTTIVSEGPVDLGSIIGALLSQQMQT